MALFERLRDSSVRDGCIMDLVEHRYSITLCLCCSRGSRFCLVLRPSSAFIFRVNFPLFAPTVPASFYYCADSPSFFLLLQLGPFLLLVAQFCPDFASWPLIFPQLSFCPLKLLEICLRCCLVHAVPALLISAPLSFILLLLQFPAFFFLFLQNEHRKMIKAI